PDTEIDFTEQGGLLWGKEAVGKLTPGADPLKPQIVAFVDDEAGPDVAAKVQRRLQHYIDRRIATLFEPLLNIQRDETLNGLARGLGFRMVEAMGLIPRGEIADEVKALDQDARGALRKHGIRFGQFTVFLPLLLKPAPTRLRLVLWSLSQGMDEFPEAPPPGLVTVPARSDAPKGYFTMAGYRAAGDRAIRIDMLERLADMLRSEDTRGGFEAKPDMLSITGMTLEQFALLMQGLGYKAERAERAKIKPVDQAIAEAPADAAAATEAETPVADIVAEIPDEGVAPIAAEPVAETVVPAALDETPAEEVLPGESPEVAATELEVYYTFTWAPRANRPRGDRPAQGGRGPRGAQAGQPAQGDGDAAQKRDRPQRQGGKPRGKPGKGKPREPRDDQPKTYAAKPEKRNDRIDPDNPFAAALMGLRTKG
ncbi:MAG: disulfide oxidoreductase, partial [Roseovarius sp.]|nr:disulfide oxidoreductase [Roseovarius sp.]